MNQLNSTVNQGTMTDGYLKFTKSSYRFDLHNKLSFIIHFSRTSIECASTVDHFSCLVVCCFLTDFGAFEASNRLV